ncbi:MAG: ABC transporter permease [Candidatus Saccharibacteria bacterium]|nr:ABC transporter permease [Candidatus Saccharibacteria bacterium]
MSKNNRPLLTVIKFEFTRQIKKPSFWATILLIPLLVAGVMAIAFLSTKDAKTNPTLEDDTKVAITDEAGILPSEMPLRVDYTKEEGKEKVVKGDLDLYFYIPADFENTKKIDFYHISEGLEIFNMDGQAIKGILNQTVSPKFSELDILALTGNFDITDNKLTTTGENSNALGKAIIPFAILVIFFFLVTLFGGRMLMTVVEEKENRISEMILTSVSAKHLIIGKILSMMLLGVIQILTLVIPVVALVIFNRDNAIVSAILSSIELDPISIITNLVLFAFSVFLVTGFLTYIGSITPTAKDASQFIGPVIIGVVFPLYFMSSFMATEPNVVVHFLTYFPLSAPTALMLRSAFGTLTTPELLIGLAEIAILSVVVIRITVKSFQKNAINFSMALPKFRKK